MLAILPFSNSVAENFQIIRELSDSFEVFPTFERRWQWNTVLQLQLDQLLATLRSQIANNGLQPGQLYIYLNSSFQRKYFPAKTSLSSGAGLGVPSKSSVFREHNLKAAMMERAYGPDSVQNLLLNFDAKAGLCSCFNPHNNLLGIGRGSNRQEMLRGAIYEYLERNAGKHIPSDAVHAPYNDIAAQALTPEEVFGVLEQRDPELFPNFCPNTAIPWLKVTLPVSGEEKLIPAQLVSYMVNYEQVFTYNLNSNGCALGNTVEEAALFAMLEVVERDALLLTWYTKSAPKRIDLQSDVPSRIRELELLLNMRGYEVCCFDISTDIELPTVLVVLLGKNADTLAAFVTAACHFDAGDALENALAEANSLVTVCARNFFTKGYDLKTVESERKQAARDAQYFYYGYKENLPQLSFLFDNPSSLSYLKFVDSYPIPMSGVQRTFDAMVMRLKSLDYQLILCENTPDHIASLGLYCVRAYLPTLINLVFGDVPIFVSENRVLKAHLVKPWIKNVAVDRYPTLHPLG
ncbi:YcaO-like family protein [Pseudoalteromonas fenneropenaei]|uniref:YcaO-like family protein n=1 Tax=Pseudoalteromonas fenneropenaei TaxID=1737459 RepID=UPI003673636D